MTKLQHTILTSAKKYIIELCNSLKIKINAIEYDAKTFLIELSNGNLIEACSFQDACNQLECFAINLNV